VNILHVASFVGNIGDNASHVGLYYILDQLVPKYTIRKMEIRKFYQNYQGSDKQCFDKEFVEYANKFDLLILGGGGFLDYWVENSKTGTTIDISPYLVGKIKVPTLLTSMGCMPHKEVPDGNVKKFRIFLDAILSNNNIRIAVRNDGSLSSLKNDIGGRYSEEIPEILDNGFFYRCASNANFPVKRNYAAINITEDQLFMKSVYRKDINIDKYVKSIAKIVDYICHEKGLDVVFVPHIYSDIKAIYEVVKQLDNYVVRERVSVAPCIQFDDGANYLFSVYKNSDLTLASRLHSNVCSLAMNVPVIGLATLDRVRYMYDHIGASDRYVSPVSEFHFEVHKKIDRLLADKNSLVSEVDANLRAKKKESLDFYSSSFAGFGAI